MNGDMDGTAADWANTGVDNLKHQVEQLERRIASLEKFMLVVQERIRYENLHLGG